MLEHATEAVSGDGMGGSEVPFVKLIGRILSDRATVPKEDHEFARRPRCATARRQ